MERLECPGGGGTHEWRTLRRHRDLRSQSAPFHLDCQRLGPPVVGHDSRAIFFVDLTKADLILVDGFENAGTDCITFTAVSQLLANLAAMGAQVVVASQVRYQELHQRCRCRHYLSGGTNAMQACLDQTTFGLVQFACGCVTISDMRALLNRYMDAQMLCPSCGAVDVRITGHVDL